MFELISERRPVAIKPHVCCECESQITIGQRYVNQRCKIDGDFQVNKAHIECLDAGQDMFDLLQSEDNLRYFIIAGAYSDRHTARDVIAHTKKNYPVVFQRLIDHPHAPNSWKEGLHP